MEVLSWKKDSISKDKEVMSIDRKERTGWESWQFLGPCHGLLDGVDNEAMTPAPCTQTASLVFGGGEMDSRK